LLLATDVIHISTTTTNTTTTSV